MAKPGKHAANTALPSYETAAAALRAKTARLKALRLERDSATPAKVPAAKRRSKNTGPSGSLSDWLDGQVDEGRCS